jgi:2-phospho-L-lactate guanylyltransferase (CobY/MobA/RfbA family)
MATIVIPFRAEAPKSRLPERARAALAEAMLADVEAACGVLGRVVVARGGGGQGAAVLEVLREVEGAVAIVNADLPCATPADVEALVAAAPALVAARDGTTNALSLLRAADFRPLYGSGSAARFGLARLDLPNLADDVDTLDDLERVGERVGPATRAVLATLKVPA